MTPIPGLTHVHPAFGGLSVQGTFASGLFLRPPLTLMPALWPVLDLGRGEIRTGDPRRPNGKKQKSESRSPSRATEPKELGRRGTSRRKAAGQTGNHVKTGKF